VTVSVRITLPDGRSASGSGQSEMEVRRALMVELGVTELPVGTRVDVYRPSC
jgi:hypothetical protein